MKPALFPTMSQRQVLQRLHLDKWMATAKLSVFVSRGLLATMVDNSWIERRGEARSLELRLTESGLNALRAQIPIAPPTREKLPKSQKAPTGMVKEQAVISIATLELPGDLCMQVDKWAACRGFTRVEAIRWLVELGLKAKGK